MAETESWTGGSVSGQHPQSHIIWTVIAEAYVRKLDAV
jgi:hypothetical protein